VDTLEQNKTEDYNTPSPWKSLAAGFAAALIPLIVFAIDKIWHFHLYQYTLLPRNLSGLRGIIFTPLIHGSWGHLMSNFTAIFALVALLHHHFRPFFYQLLIFIWVASGLWAWGFARPNYHLGASGIIYGLASFGFTSGILSGNLRLRSLSLLIAFLYGGFVWGIWPLPFNELISWELHLTGLLSGLGGAYIFKNQLPKAESASWDEEDEEMEFNEDYSDDSVDPNDEKEYPEKYS